MRLLSSLRSRIFLTAAVVAVASIGVSVWMVNILVTEQAERELQRGLEEAATLVEEYRALSVAQLAQQVRLVADLPRFKAAVEVRHGPTLVPVAEDYRRQIGSTLLVVTSRDGELLAAEGLLADARVAVARWPAVRAALGGRATTFFWPLEGGVLQVVTVPIWIGPSAPDILGTLSAGIALDSVFAERIKRLTDSEIAFCLDGRVKASTLDAAHTPRLEAVLTGAALAHLALADQDFVGLRRELAATAGELGPPPTASATAAPVALVLRSRTERLRFLGTLHRALGGTALVVLLAAILLSYYVARTITRPLAAITAGMREMAATGDLTRQLALPGQALLDEDARLLAATFNAMTASIARFQREAAQRERLSSLGRLSTVVAHEIRNPLMIIKTALHALRRRDLPPERTAAAVADIDEEVGRLNGLVNEVLDFARPIRFELAPASLHAICRAADTATAAGDGGVPCHVTLDPAADEIVTDAERLRQALINLLTNARQAAAQVSGGREPGRVDIDARAVEGHLVRLTIRDPGPGIAAEDLPRIFEPYFTTKRTGTGIGLAIARNIVEGLGGRITVRSRPGDGTEVVVDLPRTGPAAPPSPGPRA